MFIYKIVNSVFTSNTYILTEEKSASAFLVDIGDILPIEEFIIKSKVAVKGIFLTHTHYDHIYGIKKILEIFPSCPVYTSSFGKQALASDKINFSRYHDDPITVVGDNIKSLCEGNKIELFPDEYLEVFETPGHDKSCLTYKLGSRIFSGDSYIPGLKVVSSFPYSNREDAEISKQRIINLAKECDLYPGHGGIYCTLK